MAHSNILQIARSWVGHIATDQDVRDKLNAVMTQSAGERFAVLAALINETVGPAEHVAAEDIAQIMEIAAGMYQGTTVRRGLPSSDDGDFSICVGGYGGHIENPDEVDDETTS